MKIALFGKPFSEDFYLNIKTLFDKLNQHNTEIVVHRDFGDFLSVKAGIHIHNSTNFSDDSGLPDDIDFIFSLGGDGTFLETVSHVRDSGIPILGINTGRLGFLANISREEISASLDDLFNGNYTLENRCLIRLNTSEGPIEDLNTALNEITIIKKNTAMISINTMLDGEYLNSYWADGLIISTPTGSTAYSMSVGGPIVLPESKNFIISPISPHNLTVRPIIVPDNRTISLEVDSRSKEFQVALDSRSYTVKTNVKLFIDKAPYCIRMVKFPTNSFYNTLRNKLMWGVDRRN
jgi:NAD+ kinase